MLGQTDKPAQRAEDLRLDLILLDIGLPRLNGIKAAQRIRDVSPESKILFLTEESSPDVGEAALEAGGAGYVVKSDAGKELAAAVRALSEGRRYISASLVGRVFVATPDPPERHAFHELQIYSSDASLLDGFARFVSGGLHAGNAVLVLATDSHRRRLDQKLQTQGFDLGAVMSSGSYISMDVADTLSSFMFDNRPDTEQFIRLVQSVLERASKAPNGAARRVLACGECAPFLWAQGGRTSRGGTLRHGGSQVWAKHPARLFGEMFAWERRAPDNAGDLLSAFKNYSSAL